MIKPEPLYLSVRDVAAYFGCGVSTVWRWVKLGSFPAPVKIGGLTRWHRSAIDSFAATRRAA